MSGNHSQEGSASDPKNLRVSSGGIPNSPSQDSNEIMDRFNQVHTRFESLEKSLVAIIEIQKRSNENISTGFEKLNSALQLLVQTKAKEYESMSTDVAEYRKICEENQKKLIQTLETFQNDLKSVLPTVETPATPTATPSSKPPLKHVASTPPTSSASISFFLAFSEKLPEWLKAGWLLNFLHNKLIETRSEILKNNNNKGGILSYFSSTSSVGIRPIEVLNFQKRASPLVSPNVLLFVWFASTTRLETEAVGRELEDFKKNSEVNCKVILVLPRYGKEAPKVSMDSVDAKKLGFEDVVQLNVMKDAVCDTPLTQSAIDTLIALVAQ